MGSWLGGGVGGLAALEPPAELAGGGMVVGLGGAEASGAPGAEVSGTDVEGEEAEVFFFFFSFGTGGT
jgi:hypothetical protein